MSRCNDTTHSAAWVKLLIDILIYFIDLLIWYPSYELSNKLFIDWTSIAFKSKYIYNWYAIVLYDILRWLCQSFEVLWALHVSDHVIELEN